MIGLGMGLTFLGYWVFSYGIYTVTGWQHVGIMDLVMPGHFHGTSPAGTLTTSSVTKVSQPVAGSSAGTIPASMQTYANKTGSPVPTPAQALQAWKQAHGGA